MNWSKSMPILSLSKVRHQSGAALMVVLLILLIMALLSTSLMSSSVVGSRLVANQQRQMELDIVARSAQAQVMSQLWNVLNVSGTGYDFSDLPTGFTVNNNSPTTVCIGQVSGQSNVSGSWTDHWYYHYWESVLTVKHNNSGARVTATAGFKYLSVNKDDANCQSYGSSGFYNLGLDPSNWQSNVANQDGESWQDDPSLKPEKPGDGGLIIDDGRVRMTYFYLHIDTEIDAGI
jgi:Tfp pilus assembly protein PilX